ncbi:hypothetical protein ABH922_005581 [Rhodococcus sp. 27YEA15]|uniref:integrase core domain-containing protein n=1 Tax=Rhodococcus sp. 27YEA15 TaxID=3156259 RepID=UPI003C7D3C4E
MVYTDRIVELGAIPSTGTVGDSFDNAMAEAVNNLYKTELIRRRGPLRTVEQVELATVEYVWWWNNQRLHGELDMRTPCEVETAYYAGLESAQPAPAGQVSPQERRSNRFNHSPYTVFDKTVLVPADFDQNVSYQAMAKMASREYSREECISARCF